MLRLGYAALGSLQSESPTTNECRNIRRLIVIPAKAGIQGRKATAVALDPRFREGDDTLLIMLMSFRAGLLGRDVHLTRVHKAEPTSPRVDLKPGRACTDEPHKPHGASREARAVQLNGRPARVAP
jgi:hypothetical protein